MDYGTIKGAIVSLLAIMAFAAGLRAAQLWYRASKVQFMPLWEKNGQIEPVDPHLSQAQWIVALLQTADKSGELNRSAALWTAWSVALSAATTLLGVLPLAIWIRL